MQATPLPELTHLERILDLFGSDARVETLDTIACAGHLFPIYGISLGSQAPDAPVLGVFGGVHGLERIGTQVVLSYLKTLAELVKWDATTRSFLEKARLVFVPLINPGGMFRKTRSNPNGVDLMRNAPVTGEKIPKYYLYSGHRFSPKLPWYQGREGEPMEREAEAVCRFVRSQLFASPLAITVDVHSGYGAVDRFWFPYARTRQPFPGLPEAFALKRLLDRTYPNHIYRVEPQAREYTTHGDLWDFLYDEYRQREQKGIFIPFALEMGSWIWIRKNFRQAFSILGAFNPINPHRQQRVLRRHLLLFEFLQRAVLSSREWAVLTDGERRMMLEGAMELWYGEQNPA
jgi:hypothetical protein